MRHKDDPNAGAVWFVGLLSLFLTLLIIVVLQGIFFRMQDKEVYRKQLSGLSDEAAQLKNSQLSSMQEYRVIDKRARRYAIPLERAMELIIEENASK